VSPRFLHAADIHLGTRQYGSRQRYLDFADTFAHLVDTANERDVDSVLLAGDVFHRHAVAPETLLQASRQLTRLRQAGIPCYVIEGNHDRPISRRSMSWLQYLASSDLLILLSAPLVDGAFRLEPWTAETRRGCWLDLPDGRRIVGAGYAGANTRRLFGKLTDLLADLPPARHTTLMLHCGLQGTLFSDYRGSIEQRDLDSLRQYVDYVALGHVHRPFERDEWIYNPGSTETVSAVEADWANRGYFVVDVADHAHQVTKVRSQRRPFLRLYHQVDPFSSPESLYRSLSEMAAEQAMRVRPGSRPVVYLSLTGDLQFDRSQLDADHLQDVVGRPLDALLCNLHDTSEHLVADLLSDERLDRGEMEHKVLVHLASRDANRRPMAEAWADLAIELKQMALAQADPEMIINEMAAHAEREGLIVHDPSDEVEAPC